MLLKREDYNMDELLHFIFSVYRATGGKYPLLEWVEEKPSTDDFPSFKSIYEPFLRRRLEKEFDELYLWGTPLFATAALVYNFEGKDIGWIPDEFKKEGNAFIEFFMISPSMWGRGYGRKILSFLLDEVEKRGMRAHVSTSDRIDAYHFYLKHGFHVVGKKGIFVIMRHD